MITFIACKFPKRHVTNFGALLKLSSKREVWA